MKHFVLMLFVIALNFCSNSIYRKTSQEAEQDNKRIRNKRQCFGSFYYNVYCVFSTLSGFEFHELRGLTRKTTDTIISFILLLRITSYTFIVENTNLSLLHQ